MSSKKKAIEQPSAGLRRSTRSTRGSIKPLIDLTKTAGEVDEDIEKQEPVEPDVSPVMSESSGEEEYGNSKANSRRSTKGISVVKQTPAKTPKNKSLKKESDKCRASGKRDTARKTQPKIEAGLTEVKSCDAADKVSQSQVNYEINVKEVDDAFDLNCSNEEQRLASDDLKTALRALGFEPRADELQKLIEKFADKEGKVSRQSFHEIMALKMAPSSSSDEHDKNGEISRVFNLLDLDKTGMITIQNLESIAKELNESITYEELQDMIREADLDGDFKINKQEFYHIMKKTLLY